MILQILSKKDKACFCGISFIGGKSSDNHPSLLLKYYKRPQVVYWNIYRILILIYLCFLVNSVWCKISPV